jgi:hypothetical protein
MLSLRAVGDRVGDVDSDDRVAPEAALAVVACLGSLEDPALRI